MNPFAIYDSDTGEIRMTGFAPNANAQQFMRDNESIWISDVPNTKPPKRIIHRVDVDTGEVIDSATGQPVDLVVAEPG